jgi:hypothetical protein
MCTTSQNISGQPFLAQQTQLRVHLADRMFTILEDTYQVCNLEIYPGACVHHGFFESLCIFYGECYGWSAVVFDLNSGGVILNVNNE